MASANLTFCLETFNTLNAELNPIYHFLALLGAHPILHVNGVRVKQNLALHLVVICTHTLHPKQ
jgi:hypothetical protein